MFPVRLSQPWNLSSDILADEPTDRYSVLIPRLPNSPREKTTNAPPRTAQQLLHSALIPRSNTGWEPGCLNASVPPTRQNHGWDGQGVDGGGDQGARNCIQKRCLGPSGKLSGELWDSLAFVWVRRVCNPFAPCKIAAGFRSGDYRVICRAGCPRAHLLSRVFSPFACSSVCGITTDCCCYRQVSKVHYILFRRHKYGTPRRRLAVLLLIIIARPGNKAKLMSGGVLLFIRLGVTRGARRAMPS